MPQPFLNNIAYAYDFINFYWLNTMLWLLGIALGVYSSMQTGHNAMPPGFALVLSIVALGILDSGAGFLAWATIAILAVINGNAAGVDEIRTLVGMFTLFATTLILGGTRPLRRKYEGRRQMNRPLVFLVGRSGC